MATPFVNAQSRSARILRSHAFRHTKAVELINNPDEPDAFDAEDWEGSLGQVRFFLRGSNFCITAADECWADERGVVHST